VFVPAADSRVFAISAVYVATTFGCSMAVPVGAWAVGFIVWEGIICSVDKVEQALAASIVIIATATIHERFLYRIVECNFSIILVK
jgi:hypothetical protein